jgi:hypothetical protein
MLSLQHKQQYDRTIFRLHEALGALLFFFSYANPLFRKNKLCKPPDTLRKHSTIRMHVTPAIIYSGPLLSLLINPQSDPNKLPRMGCNPCRAATGIEENRNAICLPSQRICVSLHLQGIMGEHLHMLTCTRHLHEETSLTLSRSDATS